MVLAQLSTFSECKELILINKHFGNYIGKRKKKGAEYIELDMTWQRKGQ